MHWRTTIAPSPFSRTVPPAAATSFASWSGCGVLTRIVICEFAAMIDSLQLSVLALYCLHRLVVHNDVFSFFTLSYCDPRYVHPSAVPAQDSGRPCIARQLPLHARG